MKKIIILLFFVISIKILAIDEIDINFFNEPKFDKNNIEETANKINKFILKQKGNNINLFSGKIIKQNHSDSLLIFTLNKLICNIAAPVDFKFSNPKIRPNFKIISLNIKNKRLPIQEQYVIKSDSIKIAIIGVYTPDILVKNGISDDAIFDYNFFKKVKNKVKELRNPKKKIDKIILLSNLSKPIDKKLALFAKPDIVLSFDYKKRSSGYLTKDTKFYSVLSSQGKVGKLKIIYHKGKIKYLWEIIKY